MLSGGNGHLSRRKLMGGLGGVAGTDLAGCVDAAAQFVSTDNELPFQFEKIPAEEVFDYVTTGAVIPITSPGVSLADVDNDGLEANQRQRVSLDGTLSEVTL